MREEYWYLYFSALMNHMKDQVSRLSWFGVNATSLLAADTKKVESGKFSIVHGSPKYGKEYGNASRSASLQRPSDGQRPRHTQPRQTSHRTTTFIET